MQLYVVPFQSCEIFTRFREFTLLHALTNVPVDEGTLRVHKIEFVVKTRPGLGDSGGVAKHRNTAVDGGELASGDADGLGVVDTELETSGTPLNQVEGGLGLECTSGSSAVAGNDVTTVQQGNSHVLAIARVADNHLVVGLEA
jgi:hypothetical protein